MEFRVVRETRQHLPAVPWQRLFNTAQRQQRAQQSTSVALVLTTPSRMAFLNQAYHHGRGPTDVLAFPAVQQRGRGLGSGDVVICPTVLRGKSDGGSFAERLAHRFVHALLHLHGHTHETAARSVAMETAVQRILRTIPPYGRHHPTQH